MYSKPISPTSVGLSLCSSAATSVRNHLSEYKQVVAACQWERPVGGTNRRWLLPHEVQYMGVSMAIGGIPKWMVYKGKSHLEMDDLGVPLF